MVAVLRRAVFLWAAGVCSAGAVGLRPVAEGIIAPTAITHAGDQRLFITEQKGRIRVIEQDKLQPAPFLDIADRVGAGGERGLLGLAFDVDYARTGLFWVNYTDKNGDTVIARYRVRSNDATRADPQSELVLLKIKQPFANHNGGQLQFGPPEGKDRKQYLYAGMGDGGFAGDPFNNSQKEDTLLGKLLRMAPSAENNPVPPYYTLPPDNPDAAQGSPRGLMWAKGLRNPWRFSFDAKTGDLWIADVGQDAWEEINRAPLGAAGLNYGWRLMEGKHCYKPSKGCDPRGLTPPLYEYAHAGERCAVIGGYVYRGTRVPALNGAYVYADYCSGEIFALRVQAGEMGENSVLLRASFRPLTFGEDMRRELYVGGDNGKVYRITP